VFLCCYCYNNEFYGGIGEMKGMGGSLIWNNQYSIISISVFKLIISENT